MLKGGGGAAGVDHMLGREGEREMHDLGITSTWVVKHYTTCSETPQKHTVELRYIRKSIGLIFRFLLSEHWLA